MDKKICIGKFRIIRKLAEGGEGSVYLAEDEKLHQYNAVKFALGEKDCRERKALREEAARLASLSDRRLPYLVDLAEGIDYTAEIMEYVEGDTLSKYLTERFPIEPDDALKLMLKITDLIAYLHESRPPVIYRDIKPDNFIVTGDGGIRLVDMGTALFGYGSAEVNVLSGTPGYAAPEQFSCRSIGREADVHALGVLYAYMLTGIDPIRNGREKCLNACTAVAGREVSGLIKKCTSNEPAARYANARELMDNLKSIQGKRSFAKITAAIGEIVSNVLIWGSIADLTVVGLKAGGITVYDFTGRAGTVLEGLDRFYRAEFREYHIVAASLTVLVIMLLKRVTAGVSGNREFIKSYDWNELYTEKSR